MCVPIQHLNYKMIERDGKVSSSAGGLPWVELTQAARQKFGGLYRNFAPGIPPGKCLLDKENVSQSLTALERAEAAVVGLVEV